MEAHFSECWDKQRRHGLGLSEAQAVPGVALIVCGADPGRAVQGTQGSREAETR